MALWELSNVWRPLPGPPLLCGDRNTDRKEDPCLNPTLPQHSQNLPGKAQAGRSGAEPLACPDPATNSLGPALWASLLLHQMETKHGYLPSFLELDTE